MSRLPDLFPSFASRSVDVGGGVELFCRLGGEGPPLLLLHGYPQTHVCWHRVAPALATRFTLVLPDLRGYGASSAPPPEHGGANYAKRAMGDDMIALMDQLGHARFGLAGHDRGGRVGYRLALDRPDRISRLAVLDIVPTHRMWSAFDAALGMKAYHWTFLAQPAPLPEMLISGDPEFFIDWTLASWTAAKSLDPFDPRALAHYRDFFADPVRIAATCADYRAGATVDVAHDREDRAAGRRIAAPLFALWGSAGFPGATHGPLDVWREWGTEVEGRAIDAGHFLPEEAPDEVADALTAFFAEGPS